MRLALVGGSYTTRSIIASAQRCINYYTEVNPKSSLVPTTHYQRPGLGVLFQTGTGPIRGLFRASNERGYLVTGTSFCLINSDNTVTPLGTIGTSQGPVSMADNGTDLMLVDGSSVGYHTTLGTTDFAAISSTENPDATFQGANFTYYVDTY